MEYKIVITVFSDKKTPGMDDLSVCVDAPAVEDMSDVVQFFGRTLANEIANEIPDRKEKWTKIIAEAKQALAEQKSKHGEK